MAFQTSVNRLSKGDRVLIVGLLIAFINSFIPWWLHGCFGGGSIGGTNLPEACYTGGSAFNGVGYLYFIVLLALIVLFVLRSFLGATVRMPDLPVRDGQIYMIGGAVMIIAAILYWLEYRSSDVGGSFFGAGGSLGPWIGLIVAIAAAAIIIVGGVLKQQDPVVAAGPRNLPPGGGGGYTPPSSSYGSPQSPPTVPPATPPTTGPPGGPPPGPPRA